MNTCIDCQANMGTPDETKEECNIAWGKCSHAYHFHCITRWQKTRDVGFQ